jgi:hypothetical protein
LGVIDAGGLLLKEGNHLHFVKLFFEKISNVKSIVFAQPPQRYSAGDAAGAGSVTGAGVVGAGVGAAGFLVLTTRATIFVLAGASRRITPTRRGFAAMAAVISATVAGPSSNDILQAGNMVNVVPPSCTVVSVIDLMTPLKINGWAATAKALERIREAAVRRRVLMILPVFMAGEL